MSSLNSVQLGQIADYFRGESKEEHFFFPPAARGFCCLANVKYLTKHTGFTMPDHTAAKVASNALKSWRGQSCSGVDLNCKAVYLKVRKYYEM